MKRTYYPPQNEILEVFSLQVLATSPSADAPTIEEDLNNISFLGY